jgi:hypothetical protein
MNKNIRRLLAQAYLEQVDIRDTTKIAEKFAELIVRECVDICEKYAEALDILEDRSEPADFFQRGVKSASRRNANAIKKHFGVEE